MRIDNRFGTNLVVRDDRPDGTVLLTSPVELPEVVETSSAWLHKWAAEGNVFNESKSHGVRQLVTAPELLSPIQ